MPGLHSSSHDHSAAPPGDLGKSQRKAAASAGHLMERFAAACDGLRARVQDGRITLPQPWHDGVLAAGAATLKGDGWFVLEFVLHPGGKLRMPSRLPSRGSMTSIVNAWMQKNPDVPQEPLLEILEGLHFSWWTAFLRLRQLRDFWESELRRNGLEQLFVLLPDAWLLDPAALPPGAVIPRLEIGGWDELAEPLAAGRAFEIQRMGGGSTAALSGNEAATTWQQYWHGERASHSASADVLVEADSETDVSTFHVIYAKSGARVDMIGIEGPVSREE